MRNIAKLKSPDYVKPTGKASGVAKSGDVKTEQFSNLKTGISMEYAERGSGSDNVIIFLHGYIDSWFVWTDVISLMPSDYHIYAVSQRGHGDTSKPAEGYTMSHFANDLREFMDEKGIAKADIVGHSMGGVIAQRFALDYPDRVNRLVLVDTGANLKGNEVIVVGFGEFVDSLTEINEEIAIAAQISSYHKKYDPEYFAGQIVETLKAPLFVWKAALDGLKGPDYRAEITSIQHPTLIVWATADDIFPWVDQQDLLTIPNSQLETLQNIGHGAYWEEPEKFTNKLVKFLRNN